MKSYTFSIEILAHSDEHASEVTDMMIDLVDQWIEHNEQRWEEDGEPHWEIGICQLHNALGEKVES